jgi:hypothetical protein
MIVLTRGLSRKAARPRLLTFILSGWNRLAAANSRSV